MTRRKNRFYFIVFPSLFFPPFSTAFSLSFLFSNCTARIAQATFLLRCSPLRRGVIELQRTENDSVKIHGYTNDDNYSLVYRSRDILKDDVLRKFTSTGWLVVSVLCCMPAIRDLFPFLRHCLVISRAICII